MINTLIELTERSEIVGDSTPAIRDQVVIRRPGCSRDEIREIARSLPRVPDSYLSVAAEIHLNNATIGYFCLSPGGPPEQGLLEKLIDSNDPTRFDFAERCVADGVYHVASWEADPIAVAHSDTIFSRGQTVMYHVADPSSPASVLADCFEQFLLIAGNLDEIRALHSHHEPAEQAREEFIAYLVANRLGEETQRTWRGIANVVLGF